jgi:hypothetical protein
MYQILRQLFDLIVVSSLSMEVKICTLKRGNIEQVINFKVKLKIFGDVL